MSEPTPGPGADLKAAREGLQVSVREVADALNLPSRVIEALEADDYEGLPPTVFTRGYLRSYARLLELSPDDLLARYPEVTEEIEAVTDARGGLHPVLSRFRPLLVPVVAAVLVVLLLLVWALSGDDADERSLPPVQEQDEAAPDSAGSENVVSPASPTAPAASAEPEVVSDPPLTEEPDRARAQAQEMEQPATGVSSVSPDDGGVQAPVSTGERPAEQAPPARAAGDETTRARRITELGDDRLLLRFSEDCWVQVKTLDGQSLYSDLNRAGGTLLLTGRAPFRVRIGYAPGASLTFNGQDIALSGFTRNNVANLVVGQ